MSRLGAGEALTGGTSETALATLRDASGRLRRAMTQAGQIAEQIERAQGNRPISAHFEEIASAIDAGPCCLAVLGLDQASRAALVAWLVGETANGPIFEASGPSLVEISLIERGYALIRDGHRLEFDRPEALHAAVKAAGLAGHRAYDSPVESLRLEWEAPPGMAGVCLLIPSSSEALAASPTALSAILARAGLLVVAGPTGLTIDEMAGEAIRSLAEAMRATWLVTTGSGPPPLREAINWASWTSPGGRLSAHIDPNLPTPPLPEGLDEPGSTLRLGLATGQYARRAESALTLIEDRLAQDAQAQETRRKALKRKLDDAGTGDRALREITEAARRTIDDAISRLGDDFQARARSRTMPNAPRQHRIAQLVEDLSADDLRMEVAGSVINLRLSPDCLDRATMVVQGLAREDLHDDLTVLDEGLTKLSADLEAILPPAGPLAPQARPTAFDEDTLWDDLRRGIRIEPRYRGEMPRRGWTERIGHARRPAFMIMMLASLVGGAFGISGSLRLALAPILLAVFIGGVIWTFRSFNKERHERIDREVSKLRDSLGQEFRQPYERTLKESQDRLEKILRAAQKETSRQADERVRSHAAEAATQATLARKEAQDKARVIEARLREIAGQDSQVQKVRQQVAEAARLIDSATRDALAPRASGAPTRI